MSKSSSTLAQRVNAAAGHKPAPALETVAPMQRRRAANGTHSPGLQGTGGVLVSAIYPPHVRQTLKFLEAKTGRKLKQLLGEAINDLCAKYGEPQPYKDDNTTSAH